MLSHKNTAVEVEKNMVQVSVIPETRRSKPPLVMHNRWVIFMFAGLGVAAIALLLTLPQRKSPRPVVAMSIVAYRHQSNTLWATVSLTNKGAGTVTYEAWGTVPFGWLKAETPAGWTNRDLAPRFTGAFVVLRPGSTKNFSLPIPSATLRWRCGFYIRPASFRERMVGRITESGLAMRLFPLYGWIVELIPYRRESDEEFKSGLFKIDRPPD